MHSNFTLHFVFSATGITVECRSRHSGHVLVTREIGKEKMLHWVADHADRQAALEFDRAIDRACDRTAPAENADGNLAGILESCTALIAMQSEHIA